MAGNNSNHVWNATTEKWVQEPYTGTTASDGSDAAAVVVKDSNTADLAYQHLVGSIGDIQGEAVELDLTGLELTRYRIKPSVDMRYVEDAVNRTQAEDWLQADATTWAALAVGQVNCKTIDVSENPWSEWQYFPEGSYLTNLWFLTDVATSPAAATVFVEAE